MADRPGMFSLKIHKFVEKAGDNVKQVVRKAALDVTQQIMAKSPVDTGRFRANWNVAFGHVDTLTTPSTDKSGQKTVERVRIQLNGWDTPLGDIFLTNSLPYAIPLEYGHSQQAPAGMVRVTVAAWNGIVEQAANEVPK